MAHMRYSWPDSDHGFQLKVHNTCRVVPSSLDRGRVFFKSRNCDGISTPEKVKVSQLRPQLLAQYDPLSAFSPAIRVALMYSRRGGCLQGHLAHTKPPAPRTLQTTYA